uniref:Headcase N-terminal domain-containing protein n=1 Tax=Anopheles farauti TaxID=69004 RepID=A0A182QUL6_9DIPT
MAPLRTGLLQPQQPQQIQLQQQPSTTSIGGVYDPFCWGISGGESDHGFESSQSGDGSGSEGAGMVRCCVPIGECVKPKATGGANLFSELGAMINLEDLRECVRVQCSNEGCTVGQYMHRECFERWEDEVLAFLKSTGRARSWSDKQRQQNLWTKKGYELVQKMCGCKCGRGHLKKDLEWNAPTTASLFGLPMNGNHQQHLLHGGGTVGAIMPSSGGMAAAARLRANSLSSISNGSCTPPASSIGGSEQSVSPIHNQAPSPASIAKLPLTPKSKVELYSERVRVCNSTAQSIITYESIVVIAR